MVARGLMSFNTRQGFRSQTGSSEFLPPPSSDEGIAKTIFKSGVQPRDRETEWKREEGSEGTVEQ